MPFITRAPMHRHDEFKGVHALPAISLPDSTLLTASCLSVGRACPSVLPTSWPFFCSCASSACLLPPVPSPLHRCSSPRCLLLSFSFSAAITSFSTISAARSCQAVTPMAAPSTAYSRSSPNLGSPVPMSARAGAGSHRVEVVFRINVGTCWWWPLVVVSSMQGQGMACSNHQQPWYSTSYHTSLAPTLRHNQCQHHREVGEHVEPQRAVHLLDCGGLDV